MNAAPYGFRILGACSEERRLVNADDAFFGYASCDERANLEREAYLSAFSFGTDFRTLLESIGSCRGFDGVCWSRWLWFDIDRTDLEGALNDARRLTLRLVERYGLDDDALLIFFSGGKGFHVGLPSSLWGPDPSALFSLTCRRLAERFAEVVSIVIDTGVYDKVRAFRAPNSRHPKTGLHKRRLSLDELIGLSIDGIRHLAEKPAPFDVPIAPPICEQATTDWLAAVQLAEQGQKVKAQRIANGLPRLNRLTLDFIRAGSGEGDRHRLLYSAARNLGEFGCPLPLAHELLTESALDCGLAPKEVHRQIECGLQGAGEPAADNVAVNPVENTSPPSAPPRPDAENVHKQLAALWQSHAPLSTVTTSPKQDEGNAHGDAWEPPQDRLGAVEPSAQPLPLGTGDAGPYGKVGGRR